MEFDKNGICMGCLTSDDKIEITKIEWEEERKFL